MCTPFSVEELLKSLIWYHSIPIKIQGLALYANLIVIRMIDYNAVLKFVIVIDILHDDVILKEASTLQIIRDEYRIKVLKFDK